MSNQKKISPHLIPAKIKMWKGKFKCIYFGVQPQMGTVLIKLLEPATRNLEYELFGKKYVEHDSIPKGTYVITPGRTLKRIKKPNKNILNLLSEDISC